MNLAQLTAYINANIFSNNSGKITGAVLAAVFLAVANYAAPINSPNFTGTPEINGVPISTGGGSGSPGGASGQIQYNNAGAFGGVTISGDGTLNASTGALVITKTNGAAFGPLATISPTGTASSSTYLNGAGAWSTPAGGGSDPGIELNVASYCNSTQLSGGSDATACLQAAIDAAFSAGKNAVVCPTGSQLVTSSSIYLDPPGNMRTSGNANPTMFAFSMALVSEGISGGGCAIKTNFNNGVGLWIGTGQGMSVRGITVESTPVWNQYRGNQNTAGIGIGIAGGGGGASRVLIDGVNVSGFYTAYESNANGVNELSDSVTIRKSSAGNCYYGFYNVANNGFINTMQDDNISCTIGLYSPSNTMVNVQGGNWSGGAKVASFTISSISALTQAYNYDAPYGITFTAVIASPDIYIPNVYNSYVIKTTHNGLVPMTMTAWNSATNTATFQIVDVWVRNYYGGNLSSLAATGVQADLQAQTTIYAAERVTLLSGNAIHSQNLYAENYGGPTTLVSSATSGTPVTVDGTYWDYDPSLTGTGTTGFYIQQAFPFVEINGADVELSNDNFASGSNAGNSLDPVVVDFVGFGARVGQLHVRNMQGFRPVERVAFNWGDGFGTGSINNGSSSQTGIIPAVSSGFGAGAFDHDYFLSPSRGYSNFVFNDADADRIMGWNATSYLGWRPNPTATPCLSPTQYGNFASLPTIANNGATPVPTVSVNYQLLWGGQVYRLCDWYLGTQAHYQFVSNHHFFSYGQGLTTTNMPGLSWNYSGGSFVVYSSNMSLLFPGLGVLLNNGSGNVLYEVTGVYPSLGYFTVHGAQSATDETRLQGTVGATYSGTAIGQEPYSITQF